MLALANHVKVPSFVHRLLGCTTAMCRSGMSMLVCSGRDIAAGEQILHSYGDLNDAQLLQTYGFVEDPARPNPQNMNVRLPTTQLQKVR